MAAFTLTELTAPRLPSRGRKRTRLLLAQPAHLQERAASFGAVGAEVEPRPVYVTV